MDIVLGMNLLLVALLIGLTAFFVGAEFAIVKVRMSRLDQLVAEGSRTAVTAKKVTSNLDYYLSACQLGITVTALGLGWLGKPTVERLLYPVFDVLGIPAAAAAVVSFVIAFSFVTFLHVVVGELAPKTLAIQFSEKMTLLLAPLLYMFGKVMFPFIWTLNGAARLLLRTIGVRPSPHEQAHSEEELRIIMAQSLEKGEIDQHEYVFVENVFKLDTLTAEQVMVPRVRMITLPDNADTPAVAKLLDTHHFSRYPVTVNGNKDQILGFVHTKSLIFQYKETDHVYIKDVLQPLPTVAESANLQQTLQMMRQTHTHMVRVVDQYGGTAGIVTMEDILEALIGDIQDEFDEEPVLWKQVDPHTYIIDAEMLVTDVDRHLGITKAAPYEGLKAGELMQQSGQFDGPGASLTVGNWKWSAAELHEGQVKRIKIQPEAGTAGAPAAKRSEEAILSS
ncbi:hemolysin family protein [Alkalicoccus luteus]|uniref:HlyC/CorC family transporter n=1 Tax=Alkalicoccus luteus TaxID=1237094 RepID=A0A969TTB8_9BACI|nr:hemolysin family protein [Alkalicoccus luteus]NJP36100.1 HlyC/CorC family transporter [Alkalicoccus luteus]